MKHALLSFSLLCAAAFVQASQAEAQKVAEAVKTAVQGAVNKANRAATDVATSAATYATGAKTAIVNAATTSKDSVVYAAKSAQVWVQQHPRVTGAIVLAIAALCVGYAIAVSGDEHDEDNAFQEEVLNQQRR